MLVNHHVASELGIVEVVVGYLDEADDFITDDVEHEDGEGVVATIDEETAEEAVATVYPTGYVIGHEEAEDGWDG